MEDDENGCLSCGSSNVKWSRVPGLCSQCSENSYRGLRASLDDDSEREGMESEEFWLGNRLFGLFDRSAPSSLCCFCIQQDSVHAGTMILVVSSFYHPHRIIENPRVRYSRNLGIIYGDGLLASHNMKYFPNELHPYIAKWVESQSRILPRWMYADVCK